ncbi:MAG: alpha/beta fold hydrolase, partial [Crocinitomicaceae bacterium]
LSLIFLIQNGVFSQSIVKQYPFNVEIKGEGKPIILIPGISCSGAVWKETTDSLKDKFECHILTLAGFNDQRPIDLKHGYISLIKEGVIKYISVELSEKPIIVGHSLGGLISMSIACSEPEIMSQLILVDSYPFAPSAFNPNATKESVLPQAKQMQEATLTLPDSLFYKQEMMKLETMITDKDNIKVASEWLMESDRETITQSVFEMMTMDLRDEIENIKVPILVLGSWYGLKDYGVTKDFVYSSLINQFSKAKDCKIEVADTSKHFIMWDQPIWFSGKIKSFISYD